MNFFLHVKHSFILILCYNSSNASLARKKMFWVFYKENRLIALNMSYNVTLFLFWCMWSVGWGIISFFGIVVIGMKLNFYPSYMTGVLVGLTNLKFFVSFDFCSCELNTYCWEDSICRLFWLHVVFSRFIHSDVFIFTAVKYLIVCIYLPFILLQSVSCW